MQPVSSDVSSTFSASRQDAKTPRFTSESPFTMRSMPSFIRLPPKLKDKAESQPFELQIGEELLRSELSYGFGLYFVVHGKPRRKTENRKLKGGCDGAFTACQAAGGASL